MINKYALGDVFDYFPLIDDKSVDLVLTSVPDLEEMGMDDESLYLDFLERAVDQISRIVKDTGFIVMCQTDRKLKGKILTKHLYFLNSFNKRGFETKDYKILIKDRIDKINLFRLNYSHILFFTKEGKIATDKRKGDFLKDIWIFPSPKNKNFWDEGFTDLIISTLTEKDDLVIDPFAGRGTTLRSAKKLGRKYFGAEIKKEIYDQDYV